MKKEWILLVSSVVVTLVIALGLIRWLAPELLGVPSDLQVVQISKKVPPFYEGVFRRDDYRSGEFILKDPLTRVRARPLFPNLGGMGPNDILGFRNKSVPNKADVVIIGDSQTYGNNATLDTNWPSQFRGFLKEKWRTVYNMSVGGWGAVQYLDMFSNATVFQPKVVVVAFYSGNDALESFQMVYGVEHWNDLIPDESLTKNDMPKITFPSPESEWWPVTFDDGVKTTFTPSLRLGSNLNHPAVHAGYAIMADAARRISEMAKKHSLKLLFTIIPTKELVYADKISKAKLIAPDDYKTLVANEKQYIDKLSKVMVGLTNAVYVDMVDPLQKAALDNISLYPENINGHPVAAGYSVIGKRIAQAADALFPDSPKGLVTVMVKPGQFQYFLINNHGLWRFDSLEFIKANGWASGSVPTVDVKSLEGIPFRGMVDSVNSKRFGPESVY